MIDPEGGNMILDWATAIGFFASVWVIGVLIYVCRTERCDK